MRVRAANAGSIKLKDWTAAVENCSKLLKYGELPDAVKIKALYRRGISRTHLKEFADARASIAPKRAPSPHPEHALLSRATWRDSCV